jgi:glycosyltransferase involved in cell wall biosynthesis
MASLDDVLAVVVVYGKRLQEVPALGALPGLEVLVHDNSPHPQPAPPGVAYIHDPTNPGVSAAYNRALALARERGRRFVLLLDQDSVPEPGALDALESALAAYGDNDDRLLASVVHNGRDAYSPFTQGAVRNRTIPLTELAPAASFSLKGRGLINSGLVVPVALTDHIGGFDDRLSLDFSDTYFVEHYRALHRDVFLTGVRLRHSLSGDEGKDAARELSRFEHYCSGAAEMVRTGTSRSWMTRLVAFRTIRLVAKYRTLRPVGTAWLRYARVILRTRVGDAK